MSVQKLYAGAKLREIRTRLQLTQKGFAERLGVSLPYLNQMENNNRPVSTAVVLALAREFGTDVTELATGDSERMVSDLREALADPVFPAPGPSLADLRLVASNAPGVAHALLALHHAYRQSHERLASLDEALGQGERPPRASPWEEVRDFFHYCDNYIDAVDRAAENMAQRSGKIDEKIDRLLVRLGIKLHFSDGGPLRSYDPAAKTITLSTISPIETRRFQILHQIALLTHGELLDATLDLARF